MQLRLKHLEMVVKPAALFSLHVLPLTLKHLQRIAAMQRRMIRNVVGWRRDREECWEETMRRMKSRVEHARRMFTWESWDDCILTQQWYLLHMHNNVHQWPIHVARWAPHGHRKVGRPKLRWDDHLRTYFKQHWRTFIWDCVDSSCLRDHAQSFAETVLSFRSA